MARKFTDTTGREWTVDVTIETLRRVQHELGFNMMDVVNGKADRLADLIALVDTLYVVCRSEAERAGVTDEDFGRAMAGDVLEQAAEALIHGLADFLPSARGDALRAMYRRVKQAQDDEDAALAKRIDEMSPEEVAAAIAAGAGSAFAGNPAPNAAAVVTAAAAH